VSGGLPGPEEVARLVEQAIGGGVRVTAQTELLELDGFTSIVVVDLVGQLEERLGREIPPEAIAPETFSSPATISEAVAAATSPGAAS